VNIDRKTLRAIRKECRELAHEMMLEQYKRYDDIWWNRIHIGPALLEHGREVVAEINQRMPNLLSHDPCTDPLDIVARRYGFGDTSELVDFLLAYTPRGPVEESLFNRLMDERLGEGWDAPAAATQSATVIDDVPF